MSAPLRLLSGVSSVSSADAKGQIPYLDPTKWVVFMEDFTGPLFNTASINSTTVTEGGWSVLADANATVSLATDTANSDTNGCFKNVTGAVDNANMLADTISMGWAMKTGKKFVMETYFELTAATIASSELFIGLASGEATTNFMAADGLSRTFDDGIGFLKLDASSTVNTVVGENNAFDTTSTIGTIVTATWYKLAVYYDGATLYMYLNGAQVASLTPTQIPVSVVGPTIYHKTGTGEVQTLLVDYILVAAER